MDYKSYKHNEKKGRDGNYLNVRQKIKWSALPKKHENVKASGLQNDPFKLHKSQSQSFIAIVPGWLFRDQNNQ